MKQVHLFQLILHFWFSVRDGRGKSFLDNRPQKQREDLLEERTISQIFFPSQMHTRTSTKNAPGAGTGGACTERGCPVSVTVMVELLCFLQHCPSLLAQEEGRVFCLPVCQLTHLSVQSLGAVGNPRLFLYGTGEAYLSFSLLPNSAHSCWIIPFPILPTAGLCQSFRVKRGLSLAVVDLHSLLPLVFLEDQGGEGRGG